MRPTGRSGRGGSLGGWALWSPWLDSPGLWWEGSSHAWAWSPHPQLGGREAEKLVSGLWEGSPHLDQSARGQKSKCKRDPSAPKSENTSPSTPHPSPSLPLPPPTASRSEGPEQSLPGSFQPPPPHPRPPVGWGGSQSRQDAGTGLGLAAELYALEFHAGLAPGGAPQLSEGRAWPRPAGQTREAAHPGPQGRPLQSSLQCSRPPRDIQGSERVGPIPKVTSHLA